MPIYEFYSPDTRKIYSFFARSLSQSEETPFCPDGKKYAMKKLLSGFSITGRKADAPDLPEAEGNSDDPLRVWTRIRPRCYEGTGRAMNGMDDENPIQGKWGS